MNKLKGKKMEKIVKTYCFPEIDYHIKIQANNDGFTNDEVNHIVYDIASI